MAVKRLTRRWLLNSFAVIVLIILLVLVTAGWGVSRYYYGYVRQALTQQADTTLSILGQYAQSSSGDDFSARMAAYVASFPQKSQMELMIVDGDGAISLTSSGFLPDDTSMPDYRQAVEQGTGEWTGRAVSQRVMAVTTVSAIEGEDSLSAIRLVTSLDGVDRQITLLVSLMVMLGIGILALILFSSSYFISSIINPVGEVGLTARKIAGGDFGARLKKKNDDEIGELCDIINYMAEELGAAERMKNDFISSVSHELRTPLTAIQGWGETIQADGGKDAEMLDKGMSVIINETGRLSSMVEELLDFSRMQSGRLKLVKAKIDALAELSEAVLMYTERAKREGISLEYEETELMAPVYGDRNKLRQVFVNVIDNAIKYSDSGDTVTVTAKLEDGALRIAVSDTGIGIAPEDLSKVKTKFFKANSTRRGSGIGLAVADEIISRHGGTINLDSVFGEGTTVTITLPLYSGEDMTEIDDPDQ